MIKSAIIGCGKIAGYYDDPKNLREKHALTHAGAIYLHPRTVLDACCDINQKNLACFSKKWHIPFSFNNENLFFSFLKKSDIKILVISTPPGEHTRIIKKALLAKLKVIICEKPLSYTEKDSIKILKDIKRSNVNFTVNFTRRWADNIRSLKRNLEKNIIGKTVFFNGYYTGSYLNNCIHFVDLIHMLYGGFDSFNVFYSAKPQKTDNMEISFCFESKSGCRGSISALGRRNYGVFDFDIIGENGMIRVSDYSHNITLFKAGKSRFYKNDIELLQKPYKTKVNFKTSFYNLVDEAVDCVINRKQFSLSIKDIEKTTKTAFGIIKAAKNL